MAEVLPARNGTMWLLPESETFLASHQTGIYLEIWWAQLGSNQ
jgi:hypothetical protein